MVPHNSKNAMVQRRETQGKRYMMRIHLQMLCNTVWVATGARSKTELAQAFGYRINRPADEAANFARTMGRWYSMMPYAKGKDSGNRTTGKFREMCTLAASHVRDERYRKLLEDFKFFADIIDGAPRSLWLLHRDFVRDPLGLNESFFYQILVEAREENGTWQDIEIRDRYQSLVQIQIGNGYPEPTKRVEGHITAALQLEESLRALTTRQERTRAYFSQISPALLRHRFLAGQNLHNNVTNSSQRRPSLKLI